MKKIRAAIVGYGNIGKYVLEALEAAPDFEVAGVVRRNPSEVPVELKGYKVVSKITELEKVDVAVLCTFFVYIREITESEVVSIFRSAFIRNHASSCTNVSYGSSDIESCI